MSNGLLPRLNKDLQLSAENISIINVRRGASCRIFEKKGNLANLIPTNLGFVRYRSDRISTIRLSTWLNCPSQISFSGTQHINPANLFNPCNKLI